MVRSYVRTRKRPENTDIETLADVLRDRVRVLTICLSRSWGGLEQVAAQDVVDLVDVGIRSRILCLRDSPIHEQLADEEGVEIFPLDYMPRDYFDFRLKRELERQMLEGVNVIHLHQPSLLGTVSPWLFRKNGVALFASRHILSGHDKRNPFHALIYRRLDALIVMSDTLRRNVIETHPLRERQVRVIRLGLDFEDFDPDRVDLCKCRETWGADADTILVGMVGRIDPAKGQETLIKAAAGLSSDLPNRKIKYVIVGEETLGSESTYLQELRQMVRQFHLEDQVIFAGFQEDIPQVMGAFDLIVMPSRQEAFGLVAIEALAMARPVVISSGGSAEEIVGGGKYGLLVHPEDAFDLRRQLRRMIEDPEMRRQMGLRGREYVKTHFNRDDRIQKTLELYERCLRRRGG